MQALMKLNILMRQHNPADPDLVFEKLRVPHNINIIEDFLATDREFRSSASGNKSLNRQATLQFDPNKQMENKKMIVKNEVSSWMFKPNDNFKSKWDMIIMVSAVFNCFTIPLGVAF